MKLRSGLEVRSSCETVDQPLNHSDVASGNNTGPLAGSSASGLEVAVPLTQQTVASATDDTSPGSSKKTNITTRTQAKKVAKESPASEVPPETDVEIKDETAVHAKEGQASLKESYHGAPPTSSAAAASKGKAKATSFTKADSPVKSSTGKQNQRTTTPSKKRKTPAQHPAAKRTRKRPRKTRRARGSPKQAPPLTPPEDIPLPDLPECQVCWSTSDLATRTCEHRPRICAPCLRQHLTVCLSTNHINQFACPDLDCHELWTLKQIKLFATPEQQATFRQRKTEANPAFRRCLGPGCEGGRVYGWGDRRPRMTCRGCGFAMCFTHRMAWHEGQSCAEYDAEEEETRRRTGEEEARTGRAVKACPGCGVRIKKDGGCDQMRCRLSPCRSVFYSFEVGIRGWGKG